MQLTTIASLYLIALPIFLFIDFLWLGFFAKNFYQVQLGYLLGEVKWLPAVFFYLLFILGLTLYVIYPAYTKQSIAYAVLMGAFFGLVTYATYDLTNHATVKDWPLIVTIVDLIWGAAIGAVVAGATFLIYNSLF